MKLTTKLTIALVAVSFFAACDNKNTVSKSDADTNMLLALAYSNGLQSQIDNQIEIRGAYFQTSCSAGTCATPTSTGTRVSVSSVVGTTTGYLYVDYGTASFNVNSQIVEYNNTDRVLYYRKSGETNISAFIWVITDNKEILTCDVFNGKPTLAETKADLASRKASGKIFTTNPKSEGCNGTTAQGSFYGFNLFTKAF